MLLTSAEPWCFPSACSAVVRLWGCRPPSRTPSTRAILVEHQIPIWWTSRWSAGRLEQVASLQAPFSEVRGPFSESGPGPFDYRRTRPIGYDARQS
jgi:hypothetical protein